MGNLITDYNCFNSHTMSENEKEEKSCTFFRKPRKGGRGVRKRKGSSEEDEDEDESAVVKVQRKKNRNPMVQTSGMLLYFVYKKLEKIC